MQGECQIEDSRTNKSGNMVYSAQVWPSFQEIMFGLDRLIVIAGNISGYELALQVQKRGFVVRGPNVVHNYVGLASVLMLCL